MAEAGDEVRVVPHRHVIKPFRHLLDQGREEVHVFREDGGVLDAEEARAAQLTRLNVKVELAAALSVLVLLGRKQKKKKKKKKKKEKNESVLSRCQEADM